MIAIWSNCVFLTHSVVLHLFEDYLILKIFKKEIAMKKSKVTILSFVLFFFGLATIVSAPMAEQTYNKIQALDFSKTKIETIVEQYDKLYQQVNKVAEGALNEMSKARQNKDREAYQEAYNRYSSLAKYLMSENETNQLLERILQEDEQTRLSWAQWLYDHSRYYRPTLSIDFSVKDKSYSYAYTQKIQQRPGKEITLPSASQLQVNRNRVGVLAGWGITDDKITFADGEKITMPLTNQTLYAIWKSSVQFSDKATATNVVYEDVKENEIVKVPKIDSDNNQAYFIGWYDRFGRTLLASDTEEYTVVGKGASFEGLWKELSFEAINTLYWGFDRLPTNNQISVGFSLYNKGNVNLTNLKATLSSDSEHVSFIRDSINLRDLPSSMYITNNSRFASRNQSPISQESNTFRFVIDDKIEAKTAIPFTLTVEGGEGYSWTTQVNFSAR
jgi:hypothetical protein